MENPVMPSSFFSLIFIRKKTEQIVEYRLEHGGSPEFLSFLSACRDFQLYALF